MELSREDEIAQRAIREGVLPPDRVNWCQDLRSRIRKWGVSPPGIGEVALEKGWITKAAVSALYGPTPGEKATPAAPRRSFRARAAELARKRARRGTALFLLLALLAGAASVAIELVLLK